MSELLQVVELVLVSGLTVDFVVRRGAQVVAWLRGAEETVVADVKAVEQKVVDTVKKL